MDAEERSEVERSTRSGSSVVVEEPLEPVVQSDPEIMSGTPVFVGTRVPVDVLFDYLEEDYDLAEFLDDFPTVERGQALAALELARGAVLRLSARPHR